MQHMMGAFELGRIILCVLFGIFLGSTFCYFLLGERLLRVVRTRFPAEWRRAGSPTFLAIAAWGSAFWQPASGSNYFSFRRYKSLGDEALKRRAHMVRVWQLLCYGSIAGFVLIGCLYLFLE